MHLAVRRLSLPWLRGCPLLALQASRGLLLVFGGLANLAASSPYDGALFVAVDALGLLAVVCGGVAAARSWRVAALLGSPGQAAYACANAWLDALVAWRRAAGLPATTIDWGQWAEVGLASSLRFSVLDPITPDEGVDALGGVLAAGLTRVGVARLRLDRAAAAFPEINQIGFFADLVGELDVDDADEDWAGAEALKEMDAAEVNRVVLARLRRRISAIMGYSDESAVDTARPLTEIGLDSLMAVRMRNTIRGDFGVEPPVALLLQGANLADVALDLIRQLGLEEQESAERPNALRDRAQQRAAARQRAASRRKVGPRS